MDRQRGADPGVTLTAIINGEVYTPAAAGRVTVLCAAGRIARVGPVDVDGIRAAGLEVEVIDAAGQIVGPGLIDPHQHLIGGSGERGFASQTPEIALSELVRAGITTVVGCLGADTVTRTMEALLGRAKALKEQHLTAYVWSGGYDMPPVTLTGSIGRDMVLVEEVIGCGELALSDRRSSAPSLGELLRLVKQTHTAGTLAGKCGVTHVHMGDEPAGMQLVRALLDSGHAGPDWVYPTHVSSNEALLEEAAAMTKRAVTVDMGAAARDLEDRLQFFVDHGGDLERLTVSSDAAVTSPENLWGELAECVRGRVIDLPMAFQLGSSHAARVLQLERKGALAAGCDADIVLLDAGELAVTGVISQGVTMMRDGHVVASEPWCAESDRSVELQGRKR